MNDPTPATETPEQEMEKLIRDSCRTIADIYTVNAPVSQSVAAVLRDLVRNTTTWLRLAIEVKEAVVKPYREANKRLEADVERLTKERDAAYEKLAEAANEINCAGSVARLCGRGPDDE